MKKKMIVITLTILWMSILSLQAGIRIGVKAGVDLANAAFSTNVFKSDNITGFQVGPVIEISGLTGLGLDAAVLYNQHGMNFKITSIFNNNELKTSTLDIPLNLKIKVSLANRLGCYLTAGPCISFKLDDQSDFSSNQSLIKEEWRDKDFGVRLNFGAGLELLKHLQAGINYQFALTDDYSRDYSGSSGQTILDRIGGKTRIWSITVSYFF